MHYASKNLRRHTAVRIGMVHKEGDKTGMDGSCCRGDNCSTLTINRHMPYTVTADHIVYVTLRILGHVPVITIAKFIHPAQSCDSHMSIILQNADSAIYSQ